MFLRYILVIFQLPFLIFGVREQKQMLNIVLKDNYIENSVLSITVLKRKFNLNFFF